MTKCPLLRAFQGYVTLLNKLFVCVLLYFCGILSAYATGEYKVYTDVNNWYSYTFADATKANILFYDGNVSWSNKTNDLTNVTSSNCYTIPSATGTTTASSITCPAVLDNSSFETGLTIKAQNPGYANMYIHAWSVVKPIVSHPITIRAQRPSGWTNNLYIHFWGDASSGGPTAMTLGSDGWWSYTFAASVNTIHAILINGSSWNGDANQTVDITGITASTCYTLTTSSSKATVSSVNYYINPGTQAMQPAEATSFTQVGSSSSWTINSFVIPANTKKVWVGSPKWESLSEIWWAKDVLIGLRQSGSGTLFRPGASAVGELRIQSNSSNKNYDLSFLPTYALLCGDDTPDHTSGWDNPITFQQVHTSNVYMTDTIRVPENYFTNSYYKFYVGVLNQSGGVNFVLDNTDNNKSSTQSLNTMGYLKDADRRGEKGRFKIWEDSDAANWFCCFMRQIQDPVISISCPTYNDSVRSDEEKLVTISCSDATEHTIYYTTDGSTPTNTSLVYTAPFAITTTTTIQAVAIPTDLSTYVESSIITHTYTVFDCNNYIITGSTNITGNATTINWTGILSGESTLSYWTGNVSNTVGAITIPVTEQAATVNGLTPLTTYYFQLTDQYGCTSNIDSTTLTKAIYVVEVASGNSLLVDKNGTTGTWAVYNQNNELLATTATHPTTERDTDYYQISFNTAGLLTSLACTNIRIAVENSGILEAASYYKVPILIENNTSTASITQTDAVCETCDMVILKNATLVKGNDTKQFQQVHVYAGGTLDVPTGETLYAQNVYLRSTNDSVSQAYLTNNTGLVSTTGQIAHIKRISDNSKYLFFCLPYSCAISEITRSNGQAIGTYGVDWIIKQYNGLKRATDPVSGTNWQSLNINESLVAGKGYIIASDKDCDMLFPSHINQSSLIGEQALIVTAFGYEPEYDAIQPNHKGWNLVGTPYLNTLNGNGSLTDAADLLIHGYYVGSGNYDTSIDKDVPYVNWPNSDGATYSQKKVSEQKLDPFRCFFIQVNTTGKLDFLTTGAATGAPQRIVTNTQNEVTITVTGTSGSDQTEIIVDDSQTSDYAIGHDLEKMYAAATIPQIYSKTNGYKLAFNALPISDAYYIPLGFYAPKTDTYTLNMSGNANYSVYLVDNTTGVTTNLAQSSYTFQANKGLTEARFVISLAQRVTTSTTETADGNPVALIAQDGVLTLQNIPQGANIQITDALGRLLYRTTANSNSLQMNLGVRGVYNIQIESNGKTDVLRTIN